MRATLGLAETTGLRKVSMDEVARLGGIGRATLYMHFSGKESLIQAVADAELQRFFDDVRGAAEGIDDPDEQLVIGFSTAYRWLRGHKAFRAILRVNPDVIRPYIIGDNSVALTLAREFIQSLTRYESVPEEVQAQFAEFVARQIHSLVLLPGGVLDIDGPTGPENYARQFLVPALAALRSAPRV
ncbi:TetR/AcrR family transcriptional regulator [Gordonia polyisoprenivorans]|uniref:TetR/AcrR family transcriptional regulator n=1 Tax=Gordonia polyisoprenivorans TaxID=84595 RepID=UPI0023018477|nr:TetR/AcrR family transcriptional regulator [Gordonia polyisoprenivorans]WCB35347.1 TetR/AcrR family transcriptional regulator [Gordonia polyisoprenivorans]